MVGIANCVAKVGGLCLAAGLGLILGGCAGRSPDPAPPGRFRPTPVINVIQDSLGVADEPAAAWQNGEDPKPGDVIPVRNDGMLKPGDTVRISVFELLREGVTETNDYLVSETGRISLPEAGLVQAGGLTEAQLEQAIKQALSPAILKNPFVSVTRISSQPQMYAVLGAGVNQPGRYPLPAQAYRLTDALAAAGWQTQSHASHIYVARSEQVVQPATGLTPGQGIELLEPQTNATKPKPPGDAVIPPSAIRSDGVPQPSQPAEKFENRQEMLDLITPSARARPNGEDRTPKTKDNAGWSANEADISASVLPGGFQLLASPKASGRVDSRREEVVQSFMEFGSTTPTGVQKTPAGDVPFVFRDGEWVRVTDPQNADTGVRATPQEVPDFIPAQPPVSPQPAAPTPRRPVTEPPVAQPAPGQPEWVFRDGRWVQVPNEPGTAEKLPPATKPAGTTLPLQGDILAIDAEPEVVTQNRVIKVPVDRLLAGDRKYNIIIKPGDVVHVPIDVVGEFCITGNVVHSGYLSMTGRLMTLKQAIAAAGGFKSLPYPKYCEVTRRLGLKEVPVMVDLEAILQGEQPDFVVKPNDLINVGTQPAAGNSGMQLRSGL